jgi:hypothetical protein
MEANALALALPLFSYLNNSFPKFSTENKIEE